MDLEVLTNRKIPDRENAELCYFILTFLPVRRDIHSWKQQNTTEAQDKRKIFK